MPQTILAQLNLKVCKNFNDLQQNYNKIINFYHSSITDIIILPELATCGYLPNDSLNYQDFIDEILNINDKITSQVANKILILPTITSDGKNLYNSVLVIKNAKIIAKCNKSILPDNSVFYESRYFKAGEISRLNTCIFEFDNQTYGVLICEDIWHLNEKNNPVENLFNAAKIDNLIVVNASPYCIGKLQQRIDIAKNILQKYNANVFYCNCVGSYDGILFDGQSFALMQNNLKISNAFEEGASLHNCNELDDLGVAYKALVFGLKNFVLQQGFSKVLLGLSGGADSALVLKLAVEAFGVENVFAFGLKTKYTSQSSIDDAVNLVRNISQDFSFEIIDIEPLYQPFVETLKLDGLDLQNIQARVRANVLMAKSSQIGALLLTTGNKSEIACGYCTIYGDMCGAYNPIKDLYKTQVFALMNYINNIENNVFPQNIITKPPSAELAFNQRDCDNLPNYEILDAILFLHIEMAMSFNKIKNLKYSDIKIIDKINQTLKKQSFAITLPTKQNSGENIFSDIDVSRVQKLVAISQYKRRQSPPGSCISIKSFEAQDWRFNV